MKFDRPTPYPVDLTSKQKQIVILISEGYSSTDIGRKLGIALLTVGGHRKTILGRSGCRNWYQYMAELGDSGRLRQWKLTEELRVNGNGQG